MTAILTLIPGKAIFQNATVQIAINDLLDVKVKDPIVTSVQNSIHFGVKTGNIYTKIYILTI